MSKPTLSQSMRGSRNGFTLIELLIVIAIISLLAAILFPVFGRARQNAKRATCQSNEKQIGLAFSLYLQDNDETYPFGATSPDNTGWDRRVDPYLLKGAAGTASLLILHCPNDFSTSITAQTLGRPLRSYAMPRTTGRQDGTGTYKEYGVGSSVASRLIRGPVVGAPSSTFLIVEQQNSGSTVFLGNGAVQDRPLSIGGNPGEYVCSTTAPAGHVRAATTAAMGQDCYEIGVASHLEGFNYLYCDGHVKWLKPESTYRTPGVSYPSRITKLRPTDLWPCGPWTIADDD